MDVFKKQFEQIQKTLAGLSASQKMLTATLVAIMVMTLIYWGRYAGDSEMEPLLNAPLSADDMQRVTHVLQTENIPFDPSGDKIMVPTAKKDYALAALAYEQALPKDSSGGFDDIFGKINAFSPESTTDKLFNEATQQKLANIISNMRGVRTASVIIDPTHTRLIGGNVEPSASVSITMQNPGTADKKLAEAVAEMVAGTNANMTRSRVSVIIDGRVFPIKDRDPNMPDGELADEQAAAEQRFENNIKDVLRYMEQFGDVGAVVHANIDAITSRQTQTVYDKLQTKDTKVETDNTDTSSSTPGAAEPGTEANTGGSLSVNNPSAAPTNTSTNQHSTVETSVFPNQTTTESSKPAGMASAVSATVTVPRSFFVNIAKQASGSSKDPDDAAIEAAFEKQRDGLVHDVMTAIGLQDDKAVSLDMYYDAPLMMATGSGSSSSNGGTASSSMTVTLGGHIKEVALGALALVSLFMVSTMVKKSTPTPAIATAAAAATAAEQASPAIIGRTLDIAGEVVESNTALDGIEMDDDSIKSQQMVEQVSTLVKENPDAAATMVKRWLNRT